MADPGLVQDIAAHPLLRTGHWHGQCHLCQLARTNEEAYIWLETQLIEGVLTQQQLATELGQRWGIKADQPQISNHKCKHVDPQLAELRERWIGHRAMLEVMGERAPEEVAVVEAERAIMKLSDLLHSIDLDPKNAAGLGATIGTLSRALLTGAQVPAKIDHLELQVGEARIREQLAAGELGEALVAFVREHRPELLPLLEQPAPEAGADA